MSTRLIHPTPQLDECLGPSGESRWQLPLPLVIGNLSGLFRGGREIVILKWNRKKCNWINELLMMVLSSSPPLWMGWPWRTRPPLTQSLLQIVKCFLCVGSRVNHYRPPRPEMELRVSGQACQTLGESLGWEERSVWVFVVCRAVSSIKPPCVYCCLVSHVGGMRSKVPASPRGNN